MTTLPSVASISSITPTFQKDKEKDEEKKKFIQSISDTQSTQSSSNIKTKIEKNFNFDKSLSEDEYKILFLLLKSMFLADKLEDTNEVKTNLKDFLKNPENSSFINLISNFNTTGTDKYEINNYNLAVEAYTQNPTSNMSGELNTEKGKLKIPFNNTKDLGNLVFKDIKNAENSLIIHFYNELLKSKDKTKTNKLFTSNEILKKDEMDTIFDTNFYKILKSLLKSNPVNQEIFKILKQNSTKMRIKGTKLFEDKTSFFGFKEGKIIVKDKASKGSKKIADKTEEIKNWGITKELEKLYELLQKIDGKPSSFTDSTDMTSIDNIFKESTDGEKKKSCLITVLFFFENLSNISIDNKCKYLHSIKEKY